jgi:hypothetical protein
LEQEVSKYRCNPCLEVNFVCIPIYWATSQKIFPVLKANPDIKTVCILFVTPPRDNFKEPNLKFSLDVVRSKKKGSTSPSEIEKMYLMVDDVQIEIITKKNFADIQDEIIPDFLFLEKNDGQ